MCSFISPSRLAKFCGVPLRLFGSCGSSLVTWAQLGRGEWCGRPGQQSPRDSKIIILNKKE